MVGGMKDRTLRAKLRADNSIASRRIGPVPAGNLMCRLVTSTNRSVGPQPEVIIPLLLLIHKTDTKVSIVFSAFAPHYLAKGPKAENTREKKVKKYL